MNHVEFCKQLSKKAEDVMLKYFLNQSLEKSNKSDQTLVTIADLQINKLVIEEVKKNYPTHGVQGEEESYNLESDYLWIVDPIDGTSMFDAGIPTNVFAIALTKNKEPICACVYSPYTKQLWISANGKASCNEIPINCSTQTLDTNSRVLIGVCSNKSSDYNLHKVSEYLSDNFNASIVNLRSTIYMDMLVASGKLAANISYTKHGHDYIGSIIVKSAGGKTSTIKGEKINLHSLNNGYLSSNGFIHSQLLEVLKMFGN